MGTHLVCILTSDLNRWHLSPMFGAPSLCEPTEQPAYWTMADPTRLDVRLACRVCLLAEAAADLHTAAEQAAEW